ncbi:conjugal transfer pilus assembly protein TraU [Alphaproteobacteria bacterium]
MYSINIREVQAEPCVGKFVNPITDICWSCIFPIKIGNIPIYSGGREDTNNPGMIPCICPKQVDPVKVPVPGIPVSFWEPARLADITRTPYCMVSLGGFKIADSTKKHGSIARKGDNDALKHSFYHAHWYIYPVMYWLELLTDFLCLERVSVDVLYLSEFDPLWNNDELNAILNPEAILFGNPLAQMACSADCISATSSFSREGLILVCRM